MISKGASARVQIKLRPSGSSAKRSSIPIETFASSKSMGRVLLRRGGETVAAGECRIPSSGLERDARADIEADDAAVDMTWQVLCWSCCSDIVHALRYSILRPLHTRARCD